MQPVHEQAVEEGHILLLAYSEAIGLKLQTHAKLRSSTVLIANTRGIGIHV